MTTEERINEIVTSMTSFPEATIRKSELQAELFKLQDELVAVTFNGIHAENAKLRIQDVVAHLTKLNEERGHIADTELKTFQEFCKVICNSIRSEVTGNAGEFKAARHIEMARCKKRILRNIEFNDGERRTELDFIVFTEQAIFIIEVKNPNRDIYIDERGNYCRVSSSMIFDKNIGESMNKKSFLLRQALIDSGYEEPNIVSIVVFTNNDIRVDNQFKHIDTCFLSSLPHIIESYEGSPLYSEEDVESMIVSVNNAACKEAYPLPFDAHQFKTVFATLIAKLEGFSIEIEEPTESELSEEDAKTTDSASTSNETVTGGCETNNFNETTTNTFSSHALAVTAMATVCFVAGYLFKALRG